MQTLQELIEELDDAASIAPDNLIDSLYELIEWYKKAVNKEITLEKYIDICNTFSSIYPHQPIPQCLNIKT